jgi:hypothetical protein
LLVGVTVAEHRSSAHYKGEREYLRVDAEIG